MPRPRPWQRQSKRIRRNKCILPRPADFFGGPGVLILYGRAGCPRLSARQPPNHHGGVRARRPTQGDRGLRRGGALLPTAVPANRGTSSKLACFIRHWRRFADFPFCGQSASLSPRPPCLKGAFLRDGGIFSQIHKKFSLKLQMQLLRVEFLWYTTSTARKTGCGPNHNKEELYNEEMGMFCLRLCVRG